MLQLGNATEIAGSLWQRLWPRYVLAALEHDRIVLQRWMPSQQTPGPCWILRLPEGVIVEGQPLQVAALGELLGDFLAEQRLTGAHVLAVLPPAATRLPRGACHLFANDVLRGIDSSLVQAWIDVFARADLVLDRLVPAGLCWMLFAQPSLQGAASRDLSVFLHGESSGCELWAWSGWELWAHFRDHCSVSLLWRDVEPVLRGLMAAQGCRRMLVWFEAEEDVNPPVEIAAPGVLMHAESSGFGNVALAGLVRAELTAPQEHR